MDGGGRWGLSGVEEGRRSVRVVIEAEIDVLLASMESLGSGSGFRVHM